MRNLVGPNANVASTPVLLSDGKGGYRTENLFQVAGPCKYDSYLMDRQGAHYTDFNDYQRNNLLPKDWTITHPDNLGDPTRNASQLVTSPAHPPGFWQSVQDSGEWLTNTGGRIADSPASRAMLRDHLNESASSTNNLLREFKNDFGIYEVRDSLLAGPRGLLHIESTWQRTSDGLKLVTIIPYGRK